MAGLGPEGDDAARDLAEQAKNPELHQLRKLQASTMTFGRRGASSFTRVADVTAEPRTPERPPPKQAPTASPPALLSSPSSSLPSLSPIASSPPGDMLMASPPQSLPVTPIKLQDIAAATARASADAASDSAGAMHTSPDRVLVDDPAMQTDPTGVAAMHTPTRDVAAMQTNGPTDKASVSDAARDVVDAATTPPSTPPPRRHEQLDGQRRRLKQRAAAKVAPMQLDLETRGKPKKRALVMDDDDDDDDVNDDDNGNVKGDAAAAAASKVVGHGAETDSEDSDGAVSRSEAARALRRVRVAALAADADDDDEEAGEDAAPEEHEEVVAERKAAEASGKKQRAIGKKQHEKQLNELHRETAKVIRQATVSLPELKIDPAAPKNAMAAFLLKVRQREQEIEAVKAEEAEEMARQRRSTAARRQRGSSNVKRPVAATLTSVKVSPGIMAALAALGDDDEEDTHQPILVPDQTPTRAKAAVPRASRSRLRRDLAAEAERQKRERARLIDDYMYDRGETDSEAEERFGISSRKGDCDGDGDEDDDDNADGDGAGDTSDSEADDFDVHAAMDVEEAIVARQEAKQRRRGARCIQRWWRTWLRKHHRTVGRSIVPPSLPADVDASFSNGDVDNKAAGCQDTLPELSLHASLPQSQTSVGSGDEDNTADNDVNSGNMAKCRSNDNDDVDNEADVEDDDDDDNNQEDQHDGDASGPIYDSDDERALVAAYLGESEAAQGLPSDSDGNGDDGAAAPAAKRRKLLRSMVEDMAEDEDQLNGVGSSDEDEAEEVDEKMLEEIRAMLQADLDESGDEGELQEQHWAFLEKLEKAQLKAVMKNVSGEWRKRFQRRGMTAFDSEDEADEEAHVNRLRRTRSDLTRVLRQIEQDGMGYGNVKKKALETDCAYMQMSDSDADEPAEVVARRIAERAARRKQRKQLRSSNSNTASLSMLGTDAESQSILSMVRQTTANAAATTAKPPTPVKLASRPADASPGKPTVISGTKRFFAGVGADYPGSMGAAPSPKRPRLGRSSSFLARSPRKMAKLAKLHRANSATAGTRALIGSASVVFSDTSSLPVPEPAAAAAGAGAGQAAKQARPHKAVARLFTELSSSSMSHPGA